MPSGESPFDQDYADYDPDARPLESIKVPKRPGLPHLQQPSKWTCLPTSFAMVFSKYEHEAAGGLLLSILNQLGRDDERGFHVQEFLSIAVTLGMAFMPFEFEPVVDPAPCREGAWRDGQCMREHQTSVHGDSDWFPCEDCGGTGHQGQPPLVLWPIENLMKQSDGVLLGKRKGATHFHAVAWCKDTQLCLDPEEGIYALDNFQPITFWAAFTLD